MDLMFGFVWQFSGEPQRPERSNELAFVLAPVDEAMALPAREGDRR
jgi:hypothetical protein